MYTQHEINRIRQILIYSTKGNIYRKMSTKLDSCIFVTRETRDKLKTVAKKYQTYDMILKELIALKNSTVSGTLKNIDND